MMKIYNLNFKFTYLMIQLFLKIFSVELKLVLIKEVALCKIAIKIQYQLL